MPIYLLITLSFFLLAIGLTLVLTKQHTIFMLIGIELIVHGAHLNMLTLSNLTASPIQGHVFVMFSMIMVACETTLILAIILQIYRHYQKTTVFSSEDDRL